APTNVPVEAAYAPDQRKELHLVHALALTHAGRFDEAERVSRILRDVAETSGRLLLPYAYGERGARLYRAGAWEGARAELETGLEIAVEQGPVGRPFLAAYLLRLAVHLEDASLAERAKRRIDDDVAAGAVQPY